MSNVVIVGVQWGDEGKGKFVDLLAQEIDYVINIGRLKECDTAYLEREMKGVLALCRQAGVICKAIYENCYLTRDEILLM